MTNRIPATANELSAGEARILTRFLRRLHATPGVTCRALGRGTFGMF